MTFDFLRHIYLEVEDWPVAWWRRLYFRSLDRLEFGMKKYKKVMTPGDGRDSPQDAWEEAFDLCQYLLKCYKEERGARYLALYEHAIELLIDLEELTRGGSEPPKD